MPTLPSLTSSPRDLLERSTKGSQTRLFCAGRIEGACWRTIAHLARKISTVVCSLITSSHSDSVIAFTGTFDNASDYVSWSLGGPYSSHFNAWLLIVLRVLCRTSVFYLIGLSVRLCPKHRSSHSDGAASEWQEYSTESSLI